MSWKQFKAWAKRELGVTLAFAGSGSGEGGTAQLGRVLGIDRAKGRRKYGPEHQRRLRAWTLMQAALGWGAGGLHPPKWIWTVLDILEREDRDGWVVVYADGLVFWVSRLGEIPMPSREGQVVLRWRGYRPADLTDPHLVW